ncbi:hypothetical protein G7046_g9653 [Stylonectria norvegica]|nr:hypothetical protein G7046_g9653 [Stylonectria norvegica]
MGLIETILESISLISLLIFLSLATFVWYILARLSEHRRILALGEYGPTLKSRLPFGIDFLAHNIRTTMAQKNLENWRDNFFLATNSWTSETRILNMRVVFTADPQNIKALLATQFADYGKGALFHEEWHDFLGDSIFTTDGAQWHASRQLIRPQFTRDRVSDLHCFEDHMKTLFRAIANGGPLDGEDQVVDMAKGNGKKLDISNLFFRYTLDVTTEFLLGTDVKSLSTPKQEFAEAFNEVQRVQNILIRTAKLRPLFPKRSFWGGLKVVNQFINFYIERALRLSPEELAAKSKDDKGYTSSPSCSRAATPRLRHSRGRCTR